MTTPRPQPYTGHRLDRQRRVGERWSERPGRVEVWRSGAEDDVYYHYNELGFRGPSFHPNAKWTAFVFGESDAFGADVRFDEIWAVRAAREVARRRGLRPDEICIQNFADEGASNAHIARMVLTQCGRVRPDLVLVNFAPEYRVEGLAGGETFAAGPWVASDEVEKAVEDADGDDALRARMRERLERGRAFLEFTDKRQSLLDDARDMLLVQNTLASWRIDAVAVARHLKALTRQRTTEDAILGPLIAQLDPRFLVRFRPTKLRWTNDWSPDGLHYGPQTHAAVAQRVVQHLEAHLSHTCRPTGDEASQRTLEPAARYANAKRA
ncbi:MAG: hypothetical protein AAGA20_20970 [Planctomycetota bacterium]